MEIGRYDQAITLECMYVLHLEYSSFQGRFLYITIILNCLLLPNTLWKHEMQLRGVVRESAKYFVSCMLPEYV